MTAGYDELQSVTQVVYCCQDGAAVGLNMEWNVWLITVAHPTGGVAAHLKSKLKKTQGFVRHNNTQNFA
jgi:hypothetical protein